MAGLVDQYVLGGNSQALKMVTQMADYFSKRVQNVVARYTIERHWLSLNEETGGMNDVLYRLYTITVCLKPFHRAFFSLVKCMHLTFAYYGSCFTGVKKKAKM